MKLIFNITIILCFILLLTGQSAQSIAGVTVIQAFSFGTFVSKKNDAEYDITINTNGTYSFDTGGFIELSPPQEGIFDIDSLTPSTTIASVVVTQIGPLTAPGNTLQMLNFQELHPVSTDAGGVARITIGGTARTNGNGWAYTDQTYSGAVQIQVNF